MAQSLHLLLVEDDQSLAKILSKKLKALFPHCTITHCPTIDSAKQVLSEAVQTYFHLALIDQHLPDGMGSELLSHPTLEYTPILSMSSDDAPELPALSIKKGSRFFLPKREISGDLFIPIVAALIERGLTEEELRKEDNARLAMETIKRLLSTLQHEINNPLGAVLGALYLLKSENIPQADREKAATLLETSAQRIKDVVDKLLEVSMPEIVKKGSEELYHIPGDKAWKE